jgi:hypothetical protein
MRKNKRKMVDEIIWTIAKRKRKYKNNIKQGMSMSGIEIWYKTRCIYQQTI